MIARIWHGAAVQADGEAHAEDDRHLVERDETVSHYDVARSVWP